jgi:DNA-binding NarL/FixJ family response regulator
VPIKTVIIEDDAVFRLMIGKALRRMKGLVVTGECADGREGLDFCLRENPDLLVVDLFLPTLHGLEIIKQVRRKLTGTLILVLTGRPDAELPAKLIAEGVNGFVDKTEPLSYMLQAVDTVVKGGMFFAAHVPPKTGGGAAPAGAAADDPSVAAVQKLTPREIEVARMVSGGLSSKEVADRLNLSVRTVEKHRANIMVKLGVREVASLVRCCVQAGIVPG